MALDKYVYSIRPEFDMIYLIQTQRILKIQRNLQLRLSYPIFANNVNNNRHVYSLLEQGLKKKVGKSISYILCY